VIVYEGKEYVYDSIFLVFTDGCFLGYFTLSNPFLSFLFYIFLCTNFVELSFIYWFYLFGIILWHIHFAYTIMIHKK
jgi:hypothetical protein